MNSSFIGQFFFYLAVHFWRVRREEAGSRAGSGTGRGACRVVRGLEAWLRGGWAEHWIWSGNGN